MKKLLLFIILYINYCLVNAQQFIPVKDTIIQSSTYDSLYSSVFQKIIPFQDSGIIVLSNHDSISPNSTVISGVSITAFDKNLNLLWSNFFQLSIHAFSKFFAITDSNYTIYFTYFNGSGSSFAQISSNGTVLMNEQIDTLISPNTSRMFDIRWYNGNILMYGSIYNSQTSFSPFIASFQKDGSLYKKKILATGTCYYGASYLCLNITNDNTVSLTYQNDTLNNLMIACYDSSYSIIWDTLISNKITFPYNFFSQGENVVFMYLSDINNQVTILKFNSKTGKLVKVINQIYNFYTSSSNFILPTKNGKYLNFGGSDSYRSIENDVDYFDDNGEISDYANSPLSSENPILNDACIIGNYLYTSSIILIDKYSSTLPRGVLWLNKYYTDFLNNNVGIREVSNKKVDITIYPNPFSEQLFIATRNSTNNVEVDLFDEIGRSIPVNFQVSNDRIMVDTKNLVKGIYFVTISHNGEITRSKIIKY